MSQVKVFGLAKTLRPRRRMLSDAIHGCVMDVLGLPAGKRAHRFFPMDPEDFFMPEGRSDDYTIIEVMMMTGRSKNTRKRLVRELFDRISLATGIRQHDIEICIVESPPENWGFRGLHGDEAFLSYNVQV